MKYRRVCLESISYTLPEDVVATTDIERRLESVYRRFHLLPGLLRGMYGIEQRRFWHAGTLPSTKSIESAKKVIQNSRLDPSQIGALIHGSVCRDYTEPATACIVHDALGLPIECMMFDLSNACLGILTGIVQIANMIELGHIRAGIVVGTECSRRLTETTIDLLVSDNSMTRDQVGQAMASLTTGSASTAVLLVHESLSQSGRRLMAAIGCGNGAGYRLCHSGRDESIAGDVPHVMRTNSGPLVREGIALTTSAFERLLQEVGWTRDDLDHTICHQVGSVPRKQMLQSLRINPDIDITSYQQFGNTGAAAIPLTLALAVESRVIETGQRIALLGNGSGVNSLVLAVE